jgi:hypothetical protein
LHALLGVEKFRKKGGSRVGPPPMKLNVIAESSRNTSLYINNYKHDEGTRDAEFGEFSSKKDGLYF